MRFRTFVSIYASIAGMAASVDVAVGKLGPALVLSTLALSMVSLSVQALVAFRWVKPSPVAFSSWLTGSIIILAITLCFSRIGQEEAKAAELIFTYCALIQAFPTSLLLPFVLIGFRAILPDDYQGRIMVMGGLSLLLGGIQFAFSAWLVQRAEKRRLELRMK